MGTGASCPPLDFHNDTANVCTASPRFAKTSQLSLIVVLYRIKMQGQSNVE